MTTGRLRRNARFVLCIALAGACHRAPPQVAAAPCTSDRVVVVRNESGSPIDVFLITRQSERAGQALGTARQGVTEFALPPLDLVAPISFRAVRPGGETIAPAFGNRRAYNSIRYDVVCRS